MPGNGWGWWRPMTGCFTLQIKGFPLFLPPLFQCYLQRGGFSPFMEISVGAVLEGTIKSITKFGAFVTLPGGRSGLVHISEISHSLRGQCQRRAQRRTGMVKVKVVSIDEAGRINLSMKKAAPLLPGPKAPAETGRTGLISVGIPAAQAAAGAATTPAPPGAGTLGCPSARRPDRLRGPTQAVHAGLGQQTLRPENDGKTQLPAGRPPLNPPTFARILPTARRGPYPSRPPCGLFFAPFGLRRDRERGTLPLPCAGSQRILHKKL